MLDKKIAASRGAVIVFDGSVNRSLRRESVFFYRVVVHQRECTSDSCTLSKSPPLIGGHSNGEESEEGEETREEGEAEGEALRRRLGVFGAVSKASSTDPASSSERSRCDREAAEADRIE